VEQGGALGGELEEGALGVQRVRGPHHEATGAEVGAPLPANLAGAPADACQQGGKRLRLDVEGAEELLEWGAGVEGEDRTPEAGARGASETVAASGGELVVGVGGGEGVGGAADEALLAEAAQVVADGLVGTVKAVAEFGDAAGVAPERGEEGPSSRGVGCLWAWRSGGASGGAAWVDSPSGSHRTSS